MRIKILGTKGYTPWTSPLAKKFTSSRWYWNGRSLQIDIGNPYQGRQVDYLLITHLHYDHIQEFKTCPRQIKVLVPSGTFIEPLRKKNPWVDIRLFKERISLDGLSVEAFPVLHSSTTLTYGFKFFWKNKKIVWLPDYCIVPMFSEALSKVDVLFLGCGAFKKDIVHRGRGHCQKAVQTTLEKLSNLKYPPKKIFTIHYGMGSGPIILKTRFLQQKFPNLNISYTKDDMTIQI